MKMINRISRFVILLAISSLVFACANRGSGPTGGPKDITPPVMLRSVPAMHQLNVKNRNINLFFDEIVQLDNPSEKVVISPAQLQPATIKAIIKRVSIVLNDTLKPNTTYTIDFGESLADYNEKNVLKHFAFSFSTGNTIDTMEVAGTVVDARTLDPVRNILAGIYSDMNDSVFLHKPLQRVAKTTDNGTFIVRGVHDGSYRVYAISDQNGNYFFDQPAEGIAVYPEPVKTSFEMAVRDDTIRSYHGDSLKVDTIMKVKYVRYLPDSLVLRYFKEDFFRQRVIKSERTSADKISLYFGAPNDTLPVLQPLNFKWKQPPLLQRSLKNDTLTYWLKDTVAAKMDTLKMALHFQKSDSVGKLVPTIDTLLFRFYHPKPHAAAKKGARKAKEEVKKTESWRVVSDVSQDMDIDRKMRFRFDFPIISMDTSKLHFFVKVDTLWHPAALRLKQDDDVGLVYSATYPWKFDTHYKLVMDSAMFTNWRGLVNDGFTQEFRVRAEEEYSSLIVNLTPFIEHSVLELLNGKDEVIRTLKATDGQTTFKYLMPGDYYLRLYVDANENGKWDTGNFKKHQVPEQVYYYPSKITLRANWDIEQDWNPTEIPLNRQKPKVLIKKPEKTSSGSSSSSR